MQVVLHCVALLCLVLLKFEYIVYVADIHTVEPLTIGMDHFAHYREVVLFRRQKMYCHYIGWCIS